MNGYWRPKLPGEDKKPSNRRGTGCLLLIAAAVLVTCAFCWMLGEHPDSKGRIVASELSIFSLPAVLAAFACVYYGIKFLRKSG